MFLRIDTFHNYKIKVTSTKQFLVNFIFQNKRNSCEICRFQFSYLWQTPIGYLCRQELAELPSYKDAVNVWLSFAPPRQRYITDNQTRAPFFFLVFVLILRQHLQSDKILTACDTNACLPNIILFVYMCVIFG